MKNTLKRLSFMGKELSVETDAESSDPVSESIRNGIMPVEEQLFNLFPNQNGTFLDLGANIGAFCLSFASQGWNGFCFEASSKNASLLKNSINHNNFDIKVFETAVYSKTGKIYFVQNGPFGFIPNDVHKDMQYERIDCVSLDDWMQSEKIKEITLIKIDIEGSEVYALRGMRQFLNTFGYPPIFMEINAFSLCLQNETPLSLLTLAKNIGYNAYELIDDKLHPVSPNRFQLVAYTDYFLIHGEPPIQWLDKIAEPRIFSDKQVIDALVEQLSNPSKWDHHTPYFCYTLKDFPNYYKNPQIKEFLSDFAMGKYKNSLPSEYIEELLKKNLTWFLRKM